MVTTRADAAIPVGARRAMWLLTLALVLCMTTWFSATAVVPQLREEWALSNTTAAWLTIAVQLGFAAGAVISSVANLSDIMSPRAVIFAGALGASGANILLLGADGPARGIPLRFATGFFLAAVYPPAMKLVSTWFRAGRGRALGIMIGGLTIGNAGPHLINAVGGLDWRTVIVVVSILAFAGGAIVRLFVSEGPFPFPRARFDPRQARLVFRNRGVRLASFGYFGHMWEMFAMYAWFLVFFREVLADREMAPGAGAAAVTFVVIAAGAIGCWLGGVLGDRWGRTRTTASMLVVSGSCAATIGLLYDAPLWLLLGVAVVWGIAVVGDSPQYSAMVTELADQSYVGTALTLQTAAGFALTVVTIWLLPAFVGAVGWRWAFLLLLPGPLFGTASVLRLKSLPEAAQIAGGRG